MYGNKSRFLPIWNLRKLARMPFRWTAFFCLRICKMFSFVSEKSFPKPFPGSGWISGSSTKDDLASEMTLVLWQSNKYRLPIVQDLHLSTGEKPELWSYHQLVTLESSGSSRCWLIFPWGKFPLRVYPSSLGQKAWHSWAWGRSIFSRFLGTKLCFPSW